MTIFRRRRPAPPPAPPRVMTDVSPDGELLVSDDGGQTWKPYDFLPPELPGFTPLACAGPARCRCCRHCCCHAR